MWKIKLLSLFASTNLVAHLGTAYTHNYKERRNNLKKIFYSVIFFVPIQKKISWKVLFLQTSNPVTTEVKGNFGFTHPITIQWGNTKPCPKSYSYCRTPTPQPHKRVAILGSHPLHRGLHRPQAHQVCLTPACVSVSQHTCSCISTVISIVTHTGYTREEHC